MERFGAFEEALKASGLQIEIKSKEPMKKHTSFGIGGPAELFVNPMTEEALVFAVSKARELHLPYFILGNGSNLLVRDEGIFGIVICTRLALDYVETEGEGIEAGAGAVLSKVAAAALQNSLTGLEFASGIPGSLGGAVYMNAGAYGGQMADVVTETRYLDGENRICKAVLKDHQFGYRESVFTLHPNRIILSSKLKLAPGDKAEIKRRMDDFAQRRKDKQPLNLPSAGSAFKRPEGCFAGQLIEQAGLKGFSVGGAQVSEKHAGFIVNKGGATCSDVITLIEEIKRRVKENSGVLLEPEILII